MIDGFIDESDRRIVVDDFDIARLRLSNLPHASRPLFFLTHAHADHLRGLTPDWEYAPIHCSPVTRSLVLGRFSTFRHPHLLQPLDVADRIVLKLPPIQDIDNGDNNNNK
jgi:mRNA degradation ribonuclease J1/J2